MKSNLLVILVLVIVIGFIILPNNQTFASEPEIIYPREGFWAVGNGGIGTVSPVDWIEVDTYAFQPIYNNETSESANALGLGAPDQTAFMYFVTYDDDMVMSWDQTTAQAKVLDILNRMHTNDVYDVQVLDITLMPDGNEKINWASEGCGCTGIIVYTIGPPADSSVLTPNSLWIFYVFSINSYKEAYAETFDYIFELLTLPPEESRIAP